MGLGNDFLVNDFMFCIDHWREYCPSCVCDHRPGNNIRMEFDEATQERLEDAFVDIDDRPALNAYALGARLANKKEETYKCDKHGTVDCSDCFDWEKLILKSLKVVERLRGATTAPAAAAMNVTEGAKRAPAQSGKKKVDAEDVD